MAGEPWQGENPDPPIVRDLEARLAQERAARERAEAELEKERASHIAQEEILCAANEAAERRAEQAEIDWDKTADTLSMYMKRAETAERHFEQLAAAVRRFREAEEQTDAYIEGGYDDQCREAWDNLYVVLEKLNEESGAPGAPAAQPGEIGEQP